MNLVRSTCGSNGRHPAAIVGFAISAGGLLSACLPDWDRYDPRLSSSAGTGMTSAGGSGGIGGGSGGIGGGSGGSGGIGGGSGGSGGIGGGSGGSGGGSGGSGGGPASSSSAGSGTGGGGTGGGSGHCGGTDIIEDAFSDGQQGSVWDWINQGGAFASETGGEAVITLPDGSLSASDAAFQTKRLYNLRGDSIAVEVPTVANPSTTAKTYLRIYYDANNFIEVYQQSAQFLVATRLSGMVTQSMPLPYDPLQHRWWRFRDDTTFGYVDTSPDGVMWTNHTKTPSSMVFAMDLVRIDLGASTRGGEVAPGTARFGHLDGGGPVVGTWCPSDTFADTFDDGIQGRPWWRSYSAPSCTAGESLGRLSITLSSNGIGYCAYASASSFDMTSNSIAVEVPSMVNTGTSAEAFFRAQQDDQNRVELIQKAGKLECRQTIAGISTVLASTTYSTVAHKWWRLRESSGTFYFETNPGTGWIVQHEVSPPPIPVEAVDIVIGAGAPLMAGNPGIARFDNYNLAPP